MNSIATDVCKRRVFEANFDVCSRVCVVVIWVAEGVRNIGGYCAATRPLRRLVSTPSSPLSHTSSITVPCSWKQYRFVYFSPGIGAHRVETHSSETPPLQETPLSSPTHRSGPSLPQTSQRKSHCTTPAAQEYSERRCTGAFALSKSPAR